MARVVERGLRRTVGVPGLFATAYGNVGSSIYYALGLVAAHALGLTPVVFIFAGGLFALTAKTYAEGASMYPEAGRLLLVRAPRLQRGRLVLRRLGADARLHHHDRDQRVLRAALPGRVLPGAAPQPGRHHRRHGGDRAARRAQHPRAARVGQPEHLPGAGRPRDAGGAGGAGRRAGPPPVGARQPGPPGRRAELQGADLRALDLDGRLHGHRDRVEHGRGGARPGRGRAAGGQLRADRRAGDLRRHLDHLAERAAGHARRDGVPHAARHEVRERPGAGDRLRAADRTRSPAGVQVLRRRSSRPRS